MSLWFHTLFPTKMATSSSSSLWFCRWAMWPKGETQEILQPDDTRRNTRSWRVSTRVRLSQPSGSCRYWPVKWLWRQGECSTTLPATRCEAIVDQAVLVSGQLKEEQLLSAEQAETFSQQIQNLKGTSVRTCPPSLFSSSEQEVLNIQLRQAQEKAEGVQKQVRGTSGCAKHQEGQCGNVWVRSVLTVSRTNRWSFRRPTTASC